MRLQFIAACFAFVAVGAGAAEPTKYPTRPIRLVVASSPGGGSDILARSLGQKLTDDLGQQIVVDNRGGASGVIGTDIVAKALPDGYTLLIIQPSLTINPSMIKKLPYDAVRDFAPISLVVDAAQILSAHPSVPAKDAKELIALAKAQPGKLIFGSPGIGTSPHLTAELFKLTAGVQIPQVLFKGSGPAFVSLMSGEVSASFSTVLSALPHVKNGKIRALGVTTRKRAAVLPDVPTIAESALPGFESSQWFGILAPARTPRAIVDKVNAAVSRALELPDVKQRMADVGFEIVGGSPDDFAKLIREEIPKWNRTVKEAAIRGE
jgi:tripartite-type tricarboxylate transporter receptor subunit TctC